MNKTIATWTLALLATQALAQDSLIQTDTMPGKTLDSVYITSLLIQVSMRPAADVQGTYIFSGKKTEVMDISKMDIDFSNKVGRQLFVKVPGVFVYDMDGSGNQVNISARGLDPHRGWEFNIRKDGVITNSDMYGYPASHYSMPMESIERIELVRGTGSLQYGAQFGGMLNYVSKQGDTSRPFSFESINTIGSYKLLSTYNAISGKGGKFQYYAYISRKSRDGYRDSEHTRSEAQSVMLTYMPAHNLSIRAEWARAAYQYRIPGALTDVMYKENPRQATRSRNYFNPDIHIPSVTLNWSISANTKLQLTSSAVLGRRNSVMYDKPATIADTINPLTLDYNPRQVDIDRFNSYTNELRILQQYRTGKIGHTLTAGVQLMNNRLHRTQLGQGTTGSDFDLTLTNPVWGRDITFKTKNIAVFAENKIDILHNLSVNVGARIERGETDMSGKIVNYPENKIPLLIDHKFPLFGASFSYKPTSFLEIYGGWSQSYRPVLFKDVVPASVYELVDPNIKDAEGYNLELGVRGNKGFLHWDITGYIMRIDNRFGTLVTEDNGVFYTWRTNTGNSVTKGVEIFLQGDWMLGNMTAVSIFTATALVDGRYDDGSTVKAGNDNINIAGNKIESVPGLITRNGVTLRFGKLSITHLYSYTAKSYADALNTETPPPSGAIGAVPAYGIWDINTSLRVSGMIEIKANVSNVADKTYFTKRPVMYPGPGIWPSDGRNFTVSIGIRL
jgi:Outer membrane receptor for Fe3+-dicitrate